MKKILPKRRFEEFKDSEAWEQRKLGDVSQYFNGGSFENDVLAEGKYELITLKSVDMNGNLVSSGRYLNIETPTLEKGTLVMILSEQSPGLLGMTAQIPVDNKYVLNQRVAEIRPNQDINSYFLSMIINKNQQYFSKHGAGTKVQNISKPNVENFKFSCPLFHEQEKIGTFFTNLDNLITLHQRKLKKLKNIKSAYLSEMFPKDGELYPKRRFAGFNDPWEQRKLWELADKAVDNRGKTPPLDINGTHPLIEVASLGTGSPDYSKVEKYLNDYSFEHHLRDYIKKGDILFSTVGSIGLVSLMDNQENAAIAQNIVAFRAKENYSSEYLYAMFSTESNKAKAYRIVMGAVQPSIKVSQLINVEYCITNDKKEQELIGKLFLQLDNLITLHQRKLEKIEALKQAYLSEMFV